MADRLLGALLADAALPSVALRGDADTPVSDITVTGVTHDSRQVTDGTLFCCIRGGTTDGHDFAAAAVEAGAAALLVDHPIELSRRERPVAQIVVPDTRWAMGHVAAAFWGHPSRSLTMVGITGTNGKTTTASLMAAVLTAAGLPTGVIGTLTGTHTTPESPDLQARLAAFVAEGKRAVAMEVSSHALVMHRVVGCHFDVAVFTNLGRDHLDLHTTVERYFAAKAMLFEPSLSDRGVCNADDVHGRLLLDTAPVPMTSFSMSDAVDAEITATSHSYTWRGERIRVALGGAFNVMNSLAAATAGALLDIPRGVIAQGLAAVASVPGRFEAVHAGQPFDVIVDYAHTPDGLREALGAARAAVPGGRIIAVFGCGGDRDREKRPEMGEVAATMADEVVVTSDNPRSEDPLGIINAIIQGVPGDYRDRIVSEPDRRRAFATAFQMARPGDLVLIAGKGHETTQTVGTEVIPFDDRAVARELLEAAP